MAKRSALFLLTPAWLGLMAVCGGVQSEEIAAYAGKTVELSATRGTVYYAARGDAFDVVITLESDGHPLRFVSSLQPGQTTKVSTPGALGEAGSTVEIKRDGNRLLVQDHGGFEGN